MWYKCLEFPWIWPLPVQPTYILTSFTFFWPNIHWFSQIFQDLCIRWIYKPVVRGTKSLFALFTLWQREFKFLYPTFPQHHHILPDPLIDPIRRAIYTLPPPPPLTSRQACLWVCLLHYLRVRLWWLTTFFMSMDGIRYVYAKWMSMDLNCFYLSNPKYTSIAVKIIVTIPASLSLLIIICKWRQCFG